jgi:hypothetical protein
MSRIEQHRNTVRNAVATSILIFGWPFLCVAKGSSKNWDYQATLFACSLCRSSLLSSRFRLHCGSSPNKCAVHNTFLLILHPYFATRCNQHGFWCNLFLLTCRTMYIWTVSVLHRSLIQGLDPHWSKLCKLRILLWILEPLRYIDNDSCDYAVTFSSLCLDPGHTLKLSEAWKASDMIIYDIKWCTPFVGQRWCLDTKEDTAVTESSWLVCQSVDLAPMGTRTSRYEPHFASRVILVTSWMSQPETTGIQYAMTCDDLWAYMPGSLARACMP